MKKNIFILSSLSLAVLANFSDDEAKELANKAAKIRAELKLDKPSLTQKEKKIIQIRKELNLPHSKILREREEESASVGNMTLKSTVQSTVAGGESSSIVDTLSSTFSSIKNSVSQENEDESFSLYESMGLVEGEYWGMPGIFGLNEKKETSFGLHTFSDMKEFGSTFYKGFKHSGQSAEFVSGVMYYNAKMYNTMFGMFDDSPFNIFEDEDENSIFNVFEKGNDILEIFD